MSLDLTGELELEKPTVYILKTILHVFFSSVKIRRVRITLVHIQYKQLCLNSDMKYILVVIYLGPYGVLCASLMGVFSASLTLQEAELLLSQRQTFILTNF